MEFIYAGQNNAFLCPGKIYIANKICYLLLLWVVECESYALLIGITLLREWSVFVWLPTASARDTEQLTVTFRCVLDIVGFWGYLTQFV